LRRFLTPSASIELLKKLRWQVAQKTSEAIVAAKVEAKAEVELSLNLNLNLLVILT